MKQFKTVFLFELSNHFKTKAYLITTILFAVVIAVGLSFPRISELFSQKGGETGAKETLYIVAEQDLAARLSQQLPGMDVQNLQLSHEEAVAAVKSGQYSKIFYLESPVKFEYIVGNRSLYDSDGKTVREALRLLQQEASLRALNVSDSDIQQILTMPIEETTTVLSTDQSKNYFYTYALLFLMYMMVLLYGQMIATSVAKEKNSRAMEMLITSAKTQSFIYGKVCASALASFVQMAVLLLTSFLFYNLNKEFYVDNYVVQSLFAIPLSTVLYALLFFVVGFLNFAFLFGALGSTVSKLEDLNQAVTPLTLFFVAIYLLVSISMSNGNLDNPLMVAASLFPLSSPMAMLARITLGNVDALSILLSILLLIGSIIVIAHVAVKIYDYGVLMYGNKMKFSSFLKALKNK